MAGKKGRSGPVPDNIRAYCETVVRTVAITKIAQYLEKKPIGAKHWQWCYDQLVRLGQVVAAASAETKTPQEQALELLA